MDVFLEYRVRDLVATAQQQAAAKQYDAALETYRTDLDAVGGALSLDTSNQTAVQLRSQLMEAVAQVRAESHVGAAAVLPDSERRPVPAPAFELLKEGDSPLFENGAAGGYLPDPELLSIMDQTPRPVKPDYLRVVAVVVAICLLGVAFRVISYFGMRHTAVDTTSVEQRAR